MAAATVPPASSSSAATIPPPAPPKDPPAFEFTRRKRWADLLVAELSDAVALVLAADGTVWYCGAAVEELLGWRDAELVDGDFGDLVNVEDRPGFREQLRGAIRARAEMRAYVRLQCKAEFCITDDLASRPREVLFEITGRPHYCGDDKLPQGPGDGAGAGAQPGDDAPADFLCFFAVAKPYPGRNTAMLHTFLELKMENERLLQQRAALRARGAALDAAEGSPTAVSCAANASSAAPGTSAALPSAGMSPLAYPGQYPRDEVYYPGGVYDDMGAGMVGLGMQDLPGPGYAHPGASVGCDDDDDEGARKKHRRVVSAAEQHVCMTCGKTDSPEWRKGPQGPKTLCNACGLRWAKKVRKTGEPDEGEGGTGSIVF
ncbi:hypothetical protein CERSUDRAFT_122924 [Gelatoporia subvermispora B]|uniref:Uncharacterized protein n=1 Tax=Ceriporiopsis subvermispora (strain B) TaxID=914234 RepID=M2PNZ5_CERS8|nr:hypothetical protein CERSUDRAFT_122924 [Gelatoporia subvermispora B]